MFVCCLFRALRTHGNCALEAFRSGLINTNNFAPNVLPIKEIREKICQSLMDNKWDEFKKVSKGDAEKFLYPYYWVCEKECGRVCWYNSIIVYIYLLL